jgi:hypothetical protein
MGTESKAFRVVSPQHALGLVWKRDFDVADALLAAGVFGDPEISLVPRTVGLLAGEWITLDADFKAVKASGGASGKLAFAVYTSGSRYDVQATEQVTVLWGHYVARTARIGAGLAIVAGDLLTIGVAGNAGRLVEAAPGDFVVGVAEKPLEAGTTEFPNGFITYSTLGCPFVAP